MNVLGWILSAVLALAFLGSGLMKVTRPREKLLEDERMGWVNDFPANQVKGIGAVEVVGALGVILPWLLGIARVLTPIAALGLAGVMTGATIVHNRRGERQAFPITIGLLTLAVVVAVIRFTQL